MATATTQFTWTGTHASTHFVHTYTINLDTTKLAFEYNVDGTMPQQPSHQSWLKAQGTVQSMGNQTYVCTIVSTQCLPSIQMSMIRAVPDLHGATFTIQIGPANSATFSSTHSRLPSGMSLQ